MSEDFGTGNGTGDFEPDIDGTGTGGTGGTGTGGTGGTHGTGGTDGACGSWKTLSE